MKRLKDVTFSELGKLPVTAIDETHIVVAGVEATVGDTCLLIGAHNDVQNLTLVRIEDSGIDNNGRIYNLFFDNSDVEIPVISTIQCKVFGVYE